MIDAAVRYDDKHTKESFWFKARDVLSVPAMDRNFIPPRVMRETGINERTAQMISSRRSLH